MKRSVVMLAVHPISQSESFSLVLVPLVALAATGAWAIVWIGGGQRPVARGVSTAFPTAEPSSQVARFDAEPMSHQPAITHVAGSVPHPLRFPVPVANPGIPGRDDTIRHCESLLSDLGHQNVLAGGRRDA
jgi:hypothetical protein